jgi:hypothetical protein
VIIQQAANAVQSIVWKVIYSGGKMWGLFENVCVLYEVLDLKPSMVDGEVIYPDEEHKGQRGTAIEFK